jgi:FkbM family methyltransferase
MSVRISRKFWVPALVLLAAGALAALAGFDTSKLAWRASLIGLKARGQLPELGWMDIFMALYPDRLLTYQRRLAANVGFVLGDGPVHMRQRDLPTACSVFWETPLGAIWGRFEDAPTIEAIAHEIAHDGVYEYADVTVAPGDVVLDVGAHLGLFTRLALQRGAVLVVGFEPEPVNAQCLRKTFAEQIRRGSVKVVEAAAWSTQGTLKFQQPRLNNTAAGHVSGAGALSVRATTIDAVVRELGLQRVDFIKMDIEGSERHALAGAEQTLRMFAPKLAVCVYHLPDDRAVIPRLVKQLNPEYEIIRGRTQIYAFVPRANKVRAGR